MKDVNSVLYKIAATEGELVGRLKALVDQAKQRSCATAEKPIPASRARTRDFLAMFLIIVFPH